MGSALVLTAACVNNEDISELEPAVTAGEHFLWESI